MGLNMQNQLYIPPEIIIPQGAITMIFRDGKTDKIKEVYRVKNLITNLFKEAIADSIRGTTANNRGIGTYHGLGTGTTAPAISDTQLETEIFRKLISVRDVAANVATFQTFFTTSEGNATLREIGLFGDDASGTANSGKLFARVAVNRVKSSNDTLTLLHTVTIG